MRKRNQGFIMADMFEMCETIFSPDVEVQWLIVTQDVWIIPCGMRLDGANLMFVVLWSSHQAVSFYLPSPSLSLSVSPTFSKLHTCTHTPHHQAADRCTIQLKILLSLRMKQRKQERTGVENFIMYSNRSQISLTRMAKFEVSLSKQCRK